MAPFTVIEDNGGGLHLYVFDPEHLDRVVYSHSGYEHSPGRLSKDIQALRVSNPTSGWDGCESDPQASWDYWTEDQQGRGWEIIADEDGVSDRAHMGAAGQREFYPTVKEGV